MYLLCLFPFTSFLYIFFSLLKNDYNLFKMKIILWFFYLSKNKRLTFFFTHLHCFHFRFYDIFIFAYNTTTTTNHHQCVNVLFVWEKINKKKSIAPTYNRFIIAVSVSCQMLYNILFKSRYGWRKKKKIYFKLWLQKQPKQMFEQ